MRPSYKPASQSIAATGNKATTLVGLIRNFEGEIKAALPKHITPERMTRIIMTEVRKNPKLAECDQASFFGAILVCSQLGLEPGDALGHAWLVPTRVKGRMEVQLRIGYQGMVDLAERSGKVSVNAEVVYENDKLEIELGTRPYIRHIPEYKGPRGKVVAAYSVATYTDGRTKFRFLAKEDIDAAMKSAQTDKIWKPHYSEMARKTPVRRLFKMLPKSPEMAKAQELEDRSEGGDAQELEKSVPEDLKNLLTPPVDITSSEVPVETEKETPEELPAPKEEVKNAKK